MDNSNNSRIKLSNAHLRIELLRYFESGITGDNDTFQRLNASFTVSKARHKKIYDKTLLDWQGIREKAMTMQIHENAASDVKHAYLSKIERLELLSKIATGQITVKKTFFYEGQVIEHECYPDHADRIKAIAEMNKMDGSYTPEKHLVLAGVDLQQAVEYVD